MSPTRVLLLLLAACGDDVSAPPDAATVTPDAAAVPDASAAADAAPADAPPGPATFCTTQWPDETSTAVGFSTEPLYVQLDVDGVTPSGGTGIEVEVGYGPATTQPWGAGWTFFPAAWNASCGSCVAREEWVRALMPSAVGEFVWAGRVRAGATAWVYCDRADGGRLGSSDGWAAADAPRLHVAAAGSVRVVQQNLRCLLDSWDARREILADGLAATDFDVLAVEEACTAVAGGKDNVGELAAALTTRTGRSYAVVRTVTHLSWSDAYEEGLALITPHRIAASAEADLPVGAFPRKVVVARVITPQGPFVVGVTHLDHLDATTRADQAAVAAATLDGFAGGSEARLLAGDLNEGPGGGVGAALSSASFTDAWALLHGAGGLTYPSSAPTERIDQIWFRPEASAFALVEAATLFAASVGGVYASDHLGLSVRVSR